MKIPQEVEFVIKELQKTGYEAFMVGGCVRDLLRGEKPQDWDIATNAKPEEIKKIFPESFQDNRFGTVTFLTHSQDVTLKEIEITPYRIDESYSDKRHPDKIRWAKSIEEDLARRDFTINAMAADLNLKVIDPFGGKRDLEKKIIRAVGDPFKRFSEDALRMMRAVRFAVTLGTSWRIDEETEEAIKNNASFLQVISKERIRDEFLKIIMSPRADEGIEMMRKLGILKFVIPELEEGYGVSQNKHHIYDVYTHSLLSLKYAAQQGFNKYVRLAALFHDIAKPRVKKGEGPDATFYNHEVVGAKMTKKILERLRFPKKDIEKITKLVRYHLFYYNVGEVGESSVRRLIRKVGLENIQELVQLRMADRIGSGCPKALPYKLRHFLYVVDKVSQDPIDVKMLKIKGDDVMDLLKIKPGPKIGQILHILLEEVLEDPSKNKKEYLTKRVKELGELDERSLKKKFMSAKKKIDEIITKRDKMTKEKYWVA